MDPGKMLHALIFLGGAEFRLPEAARDELAAADLVIAADRGYENAAANGFSPDLLVGDMDSIAAIPAGVDVIRIPKIKDDTDTQHAIDVALERGATRVTLAGQLSGRADHTLSALFMLENLRLRGVEAEMIDDRNRVRVVKDETVVLPRRGYRYFGVLSLGETAYTARGCFYEVERVTLRRSEPYAVSNEITADAAELTFEGDAAFLVESN